MKLQILTKWLACMSREGDKPESATLRRDTALTAIERYGKIESNLQSQKEYLWHAQTTRTSYNIICDHQEHISTPRDFIASLMKKPCTRGHTVSWNPVAGRLHQLGKFSQCSTKEQTNQFLKLAPHTVPETIHPWDS